MEQNLLETSQTSQSELRIFVQQTRKQRLDFRAQVNMVREAKVLVDDRILDLILITRVEWWKSSH